jgi:uncharacterized protein (DUF1501 family)
MDRRCFLKLLGAGAAASAASFPVVRALADAPVQKDDAFIIIHASGGWDVTLWADPRNEARGAIDPATDDIVETNGVKYWKPGTLVEGRASFEMVQRNGFALGPTMGSLTDMFDRFTLINGIAMETVSHADGTYYSSTGRHLAGGRPVQTSIDSILAGETGPDDLLPLVSVNFPSTFLSRTLDARATPLRMSDVGAVGKSLYRSDLYTTSADRDATTLLLANEAAELAQHSYDPSPADRMRLQYDALGRMLREKSLLDTFDTEKLQTTLQPAFFQDATGKKIVRRFHSRAAMNAAFAVEAIKKKIVRCVSFAAGGFDMHQQNYSDAPVMYQELFEVIAQLVKQLDAEKLSSRTHILVVSEFCRTPMINIRNGRDHWPNNSALIISPRIKSKTVFGKTDSEQLLPTNALQGPSGPSQIRPSDVLATVMQSVGIEPRKHMRDGEAIKELIV